MNIRVVVIEDHPLMLRAIVEELASQPDIQVVKTALHGSELQRLVRDNAPDVVVLDLGMSSGTFEPISAVKSFKQDFPDVKVLVLTGYDDDIYVREIIAAGVSGYVLKSDDLSLMLAKGIRTVYLGKRFLSPDVVDKLLDSKLNGHEMLNEQEISALHLAAQGYGNARIGDFMNLSEKRIRNIFYTIYQKLDLSELEGMNSRITAINKAREWGYLPDHAK